MAGSRSRIFPFWAFGCGVNPWSARYPEPTMDSSGSTYVAWIALGVYLLSFLPMGFFFFYIGFLFFLNPLCHTVPQSDYKTVLGGISWLANPILFVDMVALGVRDAPHGGGVGDHLPWMRAMCCAVHYPSGSVAGLPALAWQYGLGRLR